MLVRNTGFKLYNGSVVLNYVLLKTYFHFYKKYFVSVINYVSIVEITHHITYIVYKIV